jgi:hypothetical protein
MDERLSATAATAELRRSACVAVDGRLSAEAAATEGLRSAVADGRRSGSLTASPAPPGRLPLQIVPRNAPQHRRKITPAATPTPIPACSPCVKARSSTVIFAGCDAFTVADDVRVG